MQLTTCVYNIVRYKIFFLLEIYIPKQKSENPVLKEIFEAETVSKTC